MAVGSDPAPDHRWAVYRLAGGCCTYCGRALRIDQVHLHHDQGSEAHVPASEVHCSCAQCHEEKGTRTVAEYRQLRRQRQAQQMLAALARR